MPWTVKREERITRYIFQRKHFKSSNRIKPGAFMPNKKKKTSVYRTFGCSDREVWRLGRKYVERLRTDRKKIRARADLIAGVVFDADLAINPEIRHHYRHANIEKFPPGDSEVKMKALELAENSTLHRLGNS